MKKREKKKPFNVKFFLVCLIAKADGKRQLRTNRGTGSRVSMQIFTLKSQASIIYRWGWSHVLHHKRALQNYHLLETSFSHLTSAMPLWPISTSKKSFKCHNIIRITAHQPPPPPSDCAWSQSHRDDGRMWVSSATINRLATGSAGGSKRKPPWLIIKPHISHLHALLWTANSGLLFLPHRKVCSLYWVRVHVCFGGWVAA